MCDEDLFEGEHMEDDDFSEDMIDEKTAAAY